MRETKSHFHTLRREAWGYLGWSPQQECSYFGYLSDREPLPIGEPTLVTAPPPPAMPVPKTIETLSWPIAVGVQVTNGCNLKCRYCFAEPWHSKEQVRPAVDLAKLAETLGMLRPLAVWVSGGEPTLVVGLVDFINRLLTRGIPVSLDTNATQLPAGLSALAKSAPLLTLRVSLDGPTPVHHNQTRGLGDRTFRTLAAMAEDGVPFTAQTVLTEHSDSTLLETYELIQDLGAKRWLIYELVEAGWAIDNYDELAPRTAGALDELAEVVHDAGDTLPVFRVRGNRPRSMALVSENGDLYTVDRGIRDTAGNLLESDPAQVWERLALDYAAHTHKYLGVSRLRKGA